MEKKYTYLILAVLLIGWLFQSSSVTTRVKLIVNFDKSVSNFTDEKTQAQNFFSEHINYSSKSGNTNHPGKVPVKIISVYANHQLKQIVIQNLFFLDLKVFNTGRNETLLTGYENSLIKPPLIKNFINNC